jgi:hypothetical protein
MINVTLKTTTELLGTIPKNPEIYKQYIETKRPDGGSDDVTIEQREDAGWTGFHSDEKGIFLFEYMFKGFLKHWGNVLKDKLDVTALRSKIDDIVFISPRKVYPLREDGLIIREPDGVNERSIRVMTPMGPRVSLIRSDYLAPGAILNIQVEIIDVGDKAVKPGAPVKPGKVRITPELIRTLFENGKYAGLGQFRNGGYGRFEVVAFDEE